MEPTQKSKPFTVDYPAIPLTLTIGPGQLHSCGESGDLLVIRLNNGCQITLGPFQSREQVLNEMDRLARAHSHSHDLRPTPTTKEEYLRLLAMNPWTFPYVGSEMGVPPAEWIQEAWELDDVQWNYLDGGIIRDYLKGQGMACSKEWMEVLSNALRTDQVVEFYLTIRNAQKEREWEFREDFLRGFARHAEAIPPALTENHRPRRPEGEASRQSDSRTSFHTWDDLDDGGSIPF